MNTLEKKIQTIKTKLQAAEKKREKKKKDYLAADQEVKEIQTLLNAMIGEEFLKFGSTNDIVQLIEEIKTNKGSQNDDENKEEDI